MPGNPADITVDTSELAQFVRILNDEADPKKLRRELAKDLRGALDPAVQTARSSIQAMGHSSRQTPSPALRPSIARSIKAEVRLTGRSTGARVKVKRTVGLRGFANAPKLTNRDGWRHRVFGRDVWVEQTGKPRWFDDPMQANKKQYQAAVMRVLNAWAARIARRAS